ncbi:MAG: 50S ribosomal protein L35 [Actinomycetota bacterium]|nr:50S ribosomal protein L35 [Actinomycetota bacterium]
MPKMKSHSGAKKRFRQTGGGKVRGRHAFTSHNLQTKRPKRKRRLARPLEVEGSDAQRIKRLMGK